MGVFSFNLFMQGLLVWLCVISPATASQSSVAWSDLVSPQRLSEVFLTYGVSAARSAVDLTYSEIAVDIANGNIEISDLELAPILAWDDDYSCRIRIPRATIIGTPFEQTTGYSAQINLFDLSAPLTCLPLEVRMAYMATGQKSIVYPIISIGFSYDFPSSGLQVDLTARSPDVAGVEIRADFSYVGYDSGIVSKVKPTPVVFLRSATMTIENMGVWNALRELIPGKFTDPETGGASLSGELAPKVEPHFSAEGRDQMLRSLAAAWTSFLQRPEILVMHTGFDPNRPIFLDFQSGGDNLAADLMPRFDTLRVEARNRIPSAILKAVLAKRADIPDDQKAAVGLGLLIGKGVPKNIELGWQILEPLSAELTHPHAITIAGALRDLDASNAYRWALIAGARNQRGAMGLMRDLEAGLGLDAVLDLQSDGQPAPARVSSGDMTLSAIRTNARRSYLGLGKSKNYYEALYWSTICAAAGDTECRDIEAQIDAKLNENADWSTNTRIQNARDAATADWLQFELGDRL